MKLLTSQKGFTGAELTVAIVILMIFATLISTIFFNIYLYFSEAQRNAVASGYITQMAEMIDKMYYQEVEDNILKAKIEGMNINNGYLLTATVTPYQAGENSKDLVKTVTITASYKVGNNMKSIQIERIKAKEILITPNKPKLSDGMVPVKYVTTDEISGQGYWQITTQNDPTWYSYENKRWANVMLQDGLTVEGGIAVTDANKESLAGKKVTTLGSMFVWIPRYAYKIPEANVHTSIAGEIDIVFLYSTSDNYIDENGNMQPITNKEGYKIHPSFQNGEKTGYANGEWNTELTGFWVAKFEASSTDTTGDTYGGGNTTQLNVKVLPSAITWSNIDIINVYKVCKAMSQTGNIYGLPQEANSHLIKNSEWGAVAYLTQSKYGNRQIDTDSNSGVWNSIGFNNSILKTAIIGSSRDVNNSTTRTQNEYDTLDGPKGSTTRNVYGIYDMSGGAWDYTASVLTTGTNQYATFIKALPAHEKQEYSGTATNVSGANDNYNSNQQKYGDAIWETSTEGTFSVNSAWNGDATNFPFTEQPFFARGECSYAMTIGGIFGFSYSDGIGQRCGWVSTCYYSG